MHAGLGHLRLSPTAFWAMTPRELAAALSPPGRLPADPLDRARLSGLMALFPDAPARADADGDAT